MKPKAQRPRHGPTRDARGPGHNAQCPFASPFGHHAFVGRSVGRFVGHVLVLTWIALRGPLFSVWFSHGEAVDGSDTQRNAQTSKKANERTGHTRSNTQTNAQTNEYAQANAQASARARKQVEVRDSPRFDSELRFAVCTSPQGQAAPSHRRRR